MKAMTFLVGVAAGMTMATAAVTALYPDVPRRMLRDGRKMYRCGKRAMENMF